MINYKIKPLNLIVGYKHFKMCPQWYRFCISLSTNYEGFNLLAVIVSFQSKMLYLFFFLSFFCTLLTTGIYKRFFLFSFFFTSSLGHADDIQIVNPESFDLLIGKLWNMLKSFKENWYFHFFYSFEWFFFAFSKDWIKVKWFLCFSFDEVNKRSQVA